MGLRPESGVRPLGPEAFEADGPEPWLAIDRAVPADRWVRLVYRVGPSQDPVRPLLRLRDKAGRETFEIMAGPVRGFGEWTFRIPPGILSLAISPVAEAGPFAFSLDRIEVVGRLRLLAVAFRRKPALAIHAAWLRLTGKRVRARHFVKSIWATVPLRDYPVWRRARGGPPLADPTPIAWSEPLTLLVDTAGAPAELIERTRASLQAAVASVVPFAGEAPRVESGWVGMVRAGDTLEPGALAYFAAKLAHDPRLDALYCDEDEVDATGSLRAVGLKPDWSARLAADHGTYPGGLLIARADSALAPLKADFAEPEAKPRVGHVRRILFHRLARPPQPARRRDEESAVHPTPLVSVVIPTRDRLDLLRLCVEGLRERTAYPALEILLVDNGSEEAETLAYYVSLAADRRVRVLNRPGPFNFSRLCNQGVASARGEVVVLLNNDVEVTEPGWLGRMVTEAIRPGTGAVGARLLYPDGRLQHAGVVIGLGGAAGHIGRGRPGDEPGWLRRNRVTHEVSAVTGACLAVARARYREVDGLDEEDLPISFNDIDFCLKLRRAGYTNLMVPSATLIHHESASRGHDRAGEKQARAERESAVFAARWRALMRDDPYYHPGLSLLRFDTSLG